jgi:anti-sigma B factor antagonist
MGFQPVAIDEARGRFELALEGKVYADAAPELKAALATAVERGLRALVVDAQKLEQIDSAGLGVFVEILKKIRPNGGKIVFFGLNQNLERVFEITKLRKVMGVKTTRDDAIGALATTSGSETR